MEAVDVVNEDSGSAYEASSDNNQSFSKHGESIATTAAISGSSRSKNTGQHSNRARGQKSPSSEDIRSPSSITSSPEDQNIRENAIQWAASFQEPQSVEDIRSPRRRRSTSRTKRKAEVTASDLRAKRLKSFYSKAYLDLFNISVSEAVTKTASDDQTPLEKSQIGSSIWTPKEKYVFFSSLSRYGVGSARKIALCIKSKSELQVREYMDVLEQATRRRNLQDGRKPPPMAFIDHPAAFEISEECCSVLERAGDALAARQDSYEEQKEEAKWGDAWLLTAAVCKWIEKQKKTEDGEKNIAETLPAANLLNLKNWLDLSEKIFMNSAAPHQEKNWNILAEPGETPAIRATAFEDFHSLAVSITKRLISTTLFCTMSRLRATKARKIKHAEINRDDVEAAVKALGMKSNSSEFWRGCPRRCHLEVFDDENSLGLGDEFILMAFDEVEAILGREFTVRSSSQSRPTSQHAQSEGSISSVGDRVDSETVTTSLSESFPEFDDVYSTDSSVYSQGFESDLNDEFSGSNKRREESRKKRKGEAEASERVQEEYTCAFDNEANLMEETRLWTLLRQTAPFDIKSEPIITPDRPKPTSKEIREPNWRHSIEYWSPWETLSTPVPAEHFIRNREMRSGGNIRRANRVSSMSNDQGSTVSTDSEVSLTEFQSEEGGVRFSPVMEDYPSERESQLEENAEISAQTEGRNAIRTRSLSAIPQPTGSVAEDFTALDEVGRHEMGDF